MSVTPPVDAPLVSIIMATFNCDHTIEDALASIAAQTYPRWELVVCDDGSTDQTPSHLEAFAARLPGRVTLLRNDENRKLSHSLNRCLEHATGALIARMDADDVSDPHRLQQQVAYLSEHPDVQLVGTAMQRFDSTGFKDVLTHVAHPDRYSLRHGVCFAHATICARREVFDELGGYTVSPRTERGQDYDLWFRFYAQGFVGHNLTVPLYFVREDEAAIRRRAPRVRIDSYRTTLIGFRSLRYPKHWYLRPTLELAKILVPVRVVLAYRQRQHRRFLRRRTTTRGEAS